MGGIILHFWFQFCITQKQYFAIKTDKRILHGIKKQADSSFSPQFNRLSFVDNNF